MVRYFLGLRGKSARAVRATCVVYLLLATSYAANPQKTAIPAPPDLLLEAGRKLTFERALASERDTRGKQGFWSKLVDVVAGEREYRQMDRPYGIAVDSRGRVIVSDPGLAGIHVFDVNGNKYKFLERSEPSRDAMVEPQCVAVDAKDNIYVTDSEAGKIFVFDSGGKFRKAIGSLKGGEGYFKRPTGIAIDHATGRIFVTDTLRDRVFVLSPNGEVVRSIGKRGSGKGEFNLPTEVLFRQGTLAVVDALNARVQLFDGDGNYVSAIGEPNADGESAVLRPKGIAVDSEGHYYVGEAIWGLVQVFDEQGRLLYNFGGRGTQLGKFQIPAGVFIDNNDRVYVVDSLNARVQVFRYHAIKTTARGASR